MNTKTAKQILAQKEAAQLFDVVEPALQDPELRGYLVEHAFDKDETLRYNCVRVLWRAIDREPALFYQYWDRFAPLIVSVNGFHRSSAAQFIALLSPVDTQCKLDAILDSYLRLLDDPKVMVTHYFIGTLDRICRARPDLQKRVVTALLSIDRSKHTQQHKDLVKADILAVLDGTFGALPAELKRKAVGFAKVALDCTSPKSRKAAKAFLAAHASSD